MDELRAAQERVGLALKSQTADVALQGRLRDQGNRSVIVLSSLLRLTRVHSLDNEAFDQPINEMQGVIEFLIDQLGNVQLATVEDQVYLNGMRLRFNRRDEAGHELAREFSHHRVGGMTFHQAPSIDGLRQLLALFSSKPNPDAPRPALERALARAGLDFIELSPIYRFRMGGERPGPPNAREVAKRAVSVVDETWDNLGSNRLPNPLPIRRVVTEILQMGPGAEGLWDEPDGASAHAAHTLRVTLAALALGQLAALPADVLQDLGVAAMFHDVGYAAREGSVPARPGRPGIPGYAPPFERHPAAGVRLLLRQRGFHEAKVRRALAAIEHHRDYVDPRGRPSLFARILRIVEDYDNLVRFRGAGLPPAEALKRMVPFAGRYYDPVLLQLLINALGAHPPGTRLKLADGREVRSISTTRSPETFDKPRCVVERNADGNAPVNQEIVDLAEGGEIVKILPPW